MPPKSKSSQNTESDGVMYVAGNNAYNQLYFESNNTNKNNIPIVCPAIDVPLKTTDCLSFSVYSSHAVTIMKNEPSTTIGPNTGNQRANTKKKLGKWLRINIGDDDNNYTPISAVSGASYTLYLLKPLQKNEPPSLAYFLENQEIDHPVFLDTDGYFPLALFGGCQTSAAITKEGAILMINSSIFETESFTPKILNLPKNEKPIYVACLDKSLLILSSTGQVYTCNNLNELQIVKVKELSKIKVVQISGTKKHAFAITEDGKVLGCGSNISGQIGLGNEIKTSPKFEEIPSFKNMQITSAYAGYQHSLFQNSQGAIFACGTNSNGELLLKSELKKDIVYTPLRTIIKEGASFCITGFGLSCVFVSCQPPCNIPNKIVKKYWKDSVKQPNQKNKIISNDQESQPKADRINEMIELKSQISAMRDIIETKNKQINGFLQDNIEILKKINETKEKINKLALLRKARKAEAQKPNDNQTLEQPKRKTNDSQKSNENLNIKQNQQRSKIPEEEDNQNTIQKKVPTIVHKTSGPLLFKRNPQNIQNSKQAENNASSNNNENSDSDENENHQITDNDNNNRKENDSSSNSEDNKDDHIHNKPSNSGSSDSDIENKEDANNKRNTNDNAEEYVNIEINDSDSDEKQNINNNTSDNDKNKINEEIKANNPNSENKSENSDDDNAKDLDKTDEKEDKNSEETGYWDTNLNKNNADENDNQIKEDDELEPHKINKINSDEENRENNSDHNAENKEEEDYYNYDNEN
ncbi:hypothetical protein M9Y10_029275 [Tritrichomonas musculus]|uniref:Regulator of chromosome condensation n=1 Tax=Tritrichomonas musculus TaxID=1915356 RepID=A0ABR2KML3_9EUKA